MGWSAYLTLLPVEVLPDEVHAVDLAVVLVENGLERREVEVPTRVTS